MLKGYKIVLFAIFVSYVQSCLSGDQYCARCGGSQCLKCWGAYTSAQGTCQKYSALIEQCLVYENSNTCKECNFGYRLNNGKCIAITMENCIKLNVNGDCVACDNGNRVKDDLTCPDGADSDEECEIRGCRICETMAGKETCLQCEPGHAVYSYYDDDGNYQEKCISQVGNTLNCNRTEHEYENECIECELNYYMNYGKCVKNENLNYVLNIPEKSNSLIYKVLGLLTFLLLQLYF